jgi:hypothetical protein
MEKETYKYPYNARPEDTTKIFLSDRICEQVVDVTYLNNQIFCTIKSKIICRKEKITLSAAFIFSILLCMPDVARPIGVTPIVSSASEIHRASSQRLHQHKHVPTVNPSLDKIRFIASHRMIPLISLNAEQVHLNEEILKRLQKLRGGDLASDLGMVAICGVVYLILLSTLGVDGFTIFQQIGQWNAPTVDPGFGLNPDRSQTGLEMQKPSAMPQQNYSSLTKSERRQLADPLGRDRSIQVDSYPRLDLRYNQVEFKTSKHGPEHGLPEDSNGKTPKTETNAIALRDSLINMPNRKNIIWYIEGQYQGGTPRGLDSVNLFHNDTDVIAVYQKQPDGSNLFLTTCKLTQIEIDHFKANNGNFVTERILKEQNAVSLNIQDNKNNNNGLH